MIRTSKQPLLYAICIMLLATYSYGQKIERNLDSLNWMFHRVGDSHWYKATVPGTIYTDLLANKLIPDPFYGDNEKKIQWIDTCDWEYQAEFPITASDLSLKSEIELVFE